MKEVIKSEKAPEAVGPYSQAVRAGNLLFLSGQIPLTPEGKIIGGGIEEQTRQVMANLKAVLKTAGLTLGGLVKVTVYLKSMDDFAEFNRVYGAYFEEAPPARVCVEVAKLPKDVGVEVGAIAAYGE